MEGYPGKRALNPHEPKPTVGEPTMPKGMSAGARRYWRSFVDMLIGIRVLTEADGQALKVLCVNLDECDDLQKSIKKTGWLIKNPSGAIHTNPLVAVEMQKRREVMNGLKEFGLTPSARTRVQAVGPERKMSAVEEMCG